MKIHVLPGDSLVETFQKTNIEGEIIICRECLIDGDLSADNLEDFWRVRENYLSENYSEVEKSYEANVKSEFEKLSNVSEADEVYLWFEYELFCQANMWFCLYLLENSEAKVFRVEPIVRNEKDIWKGFGGLGANELQKCFSERKKISDEDLKFGADLWKAFQDRDFEQLQNLSKSKSECFPYLEAVCEAATEQEVRPKETVRKIIEGGETDFGKVFRKFNETEGVYGFGDLQVKKIYEEIVK